MRTEDYSVTFTRHTWRRWSVEIRLGSLWWFNHGTYRQVRRYFREKTK